jgi:hypothetical protein
MLNKTTKTLSQSRRVSQWKYKPGTSQTYIDSIIAQADLLSDMLLWSTLQYENITDKLMEA